MNNICVLRKMMKKVTVLFIPGLLLSTNLLSQNLPPNIIMSSTPVPGVYEASESITLLPGFNFSASQGSLTLSITSDAQSVQGAAIGYLWGKDYVSDAQLATLTHVMAVDLYFDATGNVFSNPGIDYFQGPNINDFQSWLDDLVERAQQRIVIL